ncbi:cation diffusion facilitator family transporter [Campylobacter sp. CCUG 57310]|uniref:cation diffusion facilitator family transporter n=1 Tax=Campylobacter sp. CCUG 57310 TaxID=2517362 RepID=UPI001565A8C0|nr:cation diffusion facilitator family transporter [Campylobacter sp. CCUG 57310]QKF92007.1 divalent metal cation transporter [Campylobacter sp. CCUG 57310]
MSAEQIKSKNERQDSTSNSLKTEKNLQRLAVITAGATAFLLAIIKLISGIYSGSISVLSSAIDSMLDCLISVLNFFALKKSNAPANDKFNFGYTKLEALAALFEGALIIAIGVFIFYESAIKFTAEEVSIDVNTGLYVMVFSLGVTGILVAFLSKVAQKTQNLIIKADALHYKSDFFTNLAVVAALLIIKFTGFTIIDAIFGVLISFYIVHSAINLLKDSVLVLMDRALEPEIIKQIEEILSLKKEISSFHGLTSRKSANDCYISVHLVFDKEILLIRAHDISDEIEEQIRSKFPQFEWHIITHLDPYDDR